MCAAARDEATLLANPNAVRFAADRPQPDHGPPAVEVRQRIEGLRDRGHAAIGTVRGHGLGHGLGRAFGVAQHGDVRTLAAMQRFQDHRSLDRVRAEGRGQQVRMAGKQLP